VGEILAEMRKSPAGIRFADACKVVTYYFGEPRQNGTSHKVWKMSWAGDPRINMQEGGGAKAKAYPLRQAVAAIDTLFAKRAAAVSPAPAPKVEPVKRAARKKRRR
jgi:hypothetical protein